MSRLQLVILALLASASMPTILEAQPRNVLIYEKAPGSFQPCEPTIAIDRNDASKMVAGAVLDFVFTSADSGLTWEVQRLKSRYGVYGDPCVVSGDSGRFYYFHLSSPSGKGWSDPDILDRIVCQRLDSIDGAWDEGWGIGYNHPKDQDKEWAVYDPGKRRLVVTWTQFDEYGSKRRDCESHIMLSASSDGRRWSEPTTVSDVPGNCVDKSQTAEGAVPALCADGSIAVAWALNGNIYFKRMAIGEGGDDVEVLEEVVAVKGRAEWTFDIPGIGRANGMPVTVSDLSGGRHHGRIYINWADQRNGVDDTDVWVVYSDDLGKSWSRPVRVNDDKPGRHQFFTWLAVDQSSGYLYAVFYDRRHHADDATDVVLAISRDGGQSWSNRVISERPFSPPGKIFFGDYNNISAVNGVIRPVWTRYDDGKLSIWTAIINE